MCSQNVERKFYDQGWKARTNGEQFTSRSTIDWQDGYKDASEADEATRQEVVKSWEP